MSLRLLSLVAALALLLAPSGRAAVFVTAPAALAPPPENASTAFFEGGSESRIGLLCHNDQVHKTDPMGLFEFITSGYSKDPREIATLQRAIKLSESTKRGAELKAMDPDGKIFILATKGNEVTGGDFNTIRLNPKDNYFLDSRSRADFQKHRNELPTLPANDDRGRATILGHEVGHRVIKGPEGRDENDLKPGGRNVELNENPIRRDLGLPDRLTYGGNRVHP